MPIYAIPAVSGLSSTNYYMLFAILKCRKMDYTLHVKNSNNYDFVGILRRFNAFQCHVLECVSPINQKNWIVKHAKKL